ncbi:MAG TPA: DUF11 domain-containing protein [Nitriliruptorales bacterium]
MTTFTARHVHSSLRSRLQALALVVALTAFYSLGTNAAFAADELENSGGDCAQGQTPAKLDRDLSPADDGESFTDGTLTVTLSNFQYNVDGEVTTVDWSSNIGVDRVFVKSGSDFPFDYDPEATSGTVGTDGQEISHLTWCYDLDPPAPDLSIAKSHDAGDQPIEPGASYTYTVTVSNSGDGDHGEFDVTDTIAAGLTIGDVTPEQNCTVDGQDVTCTFDGLTAGSDVTITIDVTTAAETCTSYANTANLVVDGQTVDSAQAGELTTNDGNDCAPDPDPDPDPEPDLSVTKSSSTQGPVEPGDSFSYTITVTNSGDGAATDVVVSDTLDSGLTFVSGAGCSAAGSVVTCAIGDVAAGADDQATFTVATAEDVCVTYVNDTYDATADNHDTVTGADTVSTQANDGNDCTDVDPGQFVCVGGLDIFVIDQETEELVGGATVDAPGGSVALPDGSHGIDDLDCGDVSVTITEIPDGYDLVSPENVDTTIVDGATSTVTFELLPTEVLGIDIENPAPEPDPVVAPTELPRTGVQSEQLLALSLALMAYGGLLLFATPTARRRRV